MSFLDNMFNPGKTHIKRANRALRTAGFRGGYMTGVGGLRGGFSFDDEGNLQSHQSLGQFQPLFEQLLGQSQGAFGRAGEGFAEYTDRFDPMMQGMGEIFAHAQRIAAMDPLERGEQITDLLRQRASGSAQRGIQDTFDRLFRSGGLSNQRMREDVLDAQSRRLADEDLGFQMAGINFGEQSVSNAFQRALGSQGSMLGTTLSLENLRNLFMNQGTGMLGAGQRLSTMPMALMGMVSNLQQARSNTQLNIARTHQNSASLAESTFMNMVNFFADLARPQGTSNTSDLENLGFPTG